MTHRALIVLSLVLGAAGCITGSPPNRHPLATAPAGVLVQVQLRKSRVTGELLEVRDSGLVILAPGEVVLVPFKRIRAARFKSVDSPYVGPRVSEKAVRQARLYSRFPAGIPEPVLRQLLNSRHQNELTVRLQ